MESLPALQALEGGRALLSDAVGRGLVAIACSDDVGELCSALLLEKAIARRGGQAEVFVAERAEEGAEGAATGAGASGNGGVRRRIIEAAPAAILLVGQPARRDGARWPDIPVVEIRNPLEAYQLVRAWTDVRGDEWIAAVAVCAALGSEPAFNLVNDRSQDYPAGHVAEAVALLNGARRAAEFSGEVALEILRAATSPTELAEGTVPGGEVLRGWRDEVNDEIQRCTRTAPRIRARVALVRFTSTAQIHDVVASRWIRRLKGMIVIGANDGALPGRVQFAVRSSDTRVDLGKFVRAFGASAVGGELAASHRRAAGGTVRTEDFDRMVDGLGLGAIPSRPLPRARPSGHRSPAKRQKPRTAS